MYSRSFLLSLSCTVHKLKSQAQYNIARLGLCKQRTRRGTRAGKSARRSKIENRVSEADDKLVTPTDPEPASSGREAPTTAPASVTIGTFNARTLKKDHRLYELTKLCKTQNYDIIGIQEHHRVLNTPTTCLDIGDGWKAHLATARPGGHGGIGFLTSPRVNNTLLNIVTLHHRIIAMTAQLHNKRLHLINCHMPTACAADVTETTDCIEIHSFKTKP